MLAVHRRNEILDLIQKNQFISVRKLCSILFYSEATIRRDLEQLEKDGAIIRIRPALSSACFITLTNSRTLPLSRTVSKPDLH